MKFTGTCLLAGLAACMIAVSATQTFAQITYVDATDGSSGNTAVAPSAGGGVFNTSGALNSQGPGGDGLWDVRAFGNNATIYQNASSGNTDDAQRLVTSVNVPLATYDVYAYFWVDSSDWRLGASLADEAGDLPLYSRNSPEVIRYYDGADATVFSSSLGANPFTSDVMVAEGNRRLYQAPLGRVTDSTIAVYIDDVPNQPDSNQRTWYDGIGYQRIPEPSTMALIGLASLGLLASRRRRDQ